MMCDVGEIEKINWYRRLISRGHVNGLYGISCGGFFFRSKGSFRVICDVLEHTAVVTIKMASWKVSGRSFRGTRTAPHEWQAVFLARHFISRPFFPHVRNDESSPGIWPVLIRANAAASAFSSIRIRQVKTNRRTSGPPSRRWTTRASDGLDFCPVSICWRASSFFFSHLHSLII